MKKKPFANEKIQKILDHYKAIWALHYLSGLAQWDLNTYMPRAGAPDRGEALAKIATLSQGIFLDRDFIASIQETEKETGLNDCERGVVRVLKRDWDRYRKLPPEFLEEFERVTNQAHLAWRQSKEESDFLKFSPWLEKIVELARRKAEYLGYENHPYDALINEFEEGWTTQDLDDFFSGFSRELREILNEILSAPGYKGESLLEGMAYDRARMEEINHEVLGYLHGDGTRLRLDTSPHPFTQGLTNRDVRITTWYGERNFGSSLTGTIHEFGHALYELQVDDALRYSPIGGGRSLGLHESQSRFWENMVGRSRAFTARFTESFKKLSPQIRTLLDKEGEAEVFRYLNLVRPSAVRVEADEVTYHFHIMLRYEIEKGLVEGSTRVKDLPEIWNDRMERYLGIVPKNDADGVLQDIHWSMGAIGYFPTYSLGTFLSAQWREGLEREFGDLDAFLYQENSVPRIQQWLGEKVHRYGSAYPFRDLARKSLQEEFSPGPMIQYLRRKYRLNPGEKS